MKGWGGDLMYVHFYIILIAAMIFYYHSDKQLDLALKKYREALAYREEATAVYKKALDIAQESLRITEIAKSTITNKEFNDDNTIESINRKEDRIN